ncbi:MAG TPA: hemerythrin domain-containing protein [Longimicrobiales bacterium]|nr:hemerythrin domain-containing protein [Longimicrobiales bacterium]
MKTATRISIGVFALALGTQTLSAQEHHAHRADVPKSMRDEHEEIVWGLENALKQPGEVGARARDLEKVLHPHFVREEQIALPPLGVLNRLIEIREVEQMQHWILPITDSLRAELPGMLAAHKVIAAACAQLGEAAKAVGNKEVMKLSEELLRHARAEEEMYYPMAILVGEIVRGRMQHDKH